jgi:hypothetical protein
MLAELVVTISNVTLACAVDDWRSKSVGATPRRDLSG